MNGSSNENNLLLFKQQATNILDIYSISIEYGGIPHSKRDEIFRFYDINPLNDEQQLIQEKLILLHYEYYGSLDRSDPNSEKNAELKEELKYQIQEIQELINLL